MSDTDKRKEQLVEKFGAEVGGLLEQREAVIEQELAILKDPAPVSPKQNKEREAKLDEVEKKKVEAMHGFFQNLSSIPEAERMKAQRGAEGEAEGIIARNEQVAETTRQQEGRARWLQKIENSEIKQQAPHGISENRFKAHQDSELEWSKQQKEERAELEEKHRDKTFDNAWTNDEFRKESGAIRWQNHKNRQR
ncbi:hypothetical protein [Stenotrophomonas maltophilia]